MLTHPDFRPAEPHVAPIEIEHQAFKGECFNGTKITAKYQHEVLTSLLLYDIFD